MFLEWPLPKLLKWFCLDEKAVRAKNRKKLWMPSPPSYGCCTRVNFVFKKHLLLQMNLSNSGLKNRSIKKFWLIFTVLKFPLGLQFSHNLSKFKIIKYISTIIHHDNYMYIFTTVNSGERCGPLASCFIILPHLTFCFWYTEFRFKFFGKIHLLEMDGWLAILCPF